MKGKVFCGVTPHSLVDFSDVLEEAAAFFWLEI